MNRYCFEQYLIDNCSPTLASLKTANLFNYRYSSTDELNKAVERWNKELSGKGITVTVLRKRENTALIYVYRAKRLAKDFSRPGVERFMKCHGYENTDIDLCLEVLGGKLVKSELFPHEIGLFLGYPLGDVIGFIDNGGKNSRCTGCWKVYCNECEAIRTFARFDKCRAVYQKMWANGRSIVQLTVA